MKIIRTEVQEERECSPGGLELQVLLPLPATCYEDRHVPPHPGCGAFLHCRRPGFHPLSHPLICAFRTLGFGWVSGTCPQPQHWGRQTQDCLLAGWSSQSPSFRFKERPFFSEDNKGEPAVVPCWISVLRQAGLHIEFQASLGYIIRLCLQKNPAHSTNVESGGSGSTHTNF